MFKRGATLFFDGRLNDICSKFMSTVGFAVKHGTYVLNLRLNSRFAEKHCDEASFVTLKRGKHEKIRCELQNSIFSNVERSPLTIQDIFMDEVQDYYVNDWCIFIKYNNCFVGYGQIIMNNNQPLIVNFGIRKEYRQRGLGDLLLTYLLNLLYDSGYREVKIKVNDDNTPAYELYRKKGFIVIEEYKTWTTLVEA
jgi:ribosomal protein S18 acetylase RimI-like enzyme